MKVLHLISTKGFFGAENMVVNLARYHQKEGIWVCLGILENGQGQDNALVLEASKLGVPYNIFSCHGKLNFKTFTELKAFILKNGIDIIHSHGYKSDFYAFFSTLFVEVKRIATCHTWYSVNLKMRLYEWLDKLVLRKFDKVIVVSGILKNELSKKGFPKESVLEIYNGIEMEPFEKAEDVGYLRQEFNLNSHSKVIGTIARLAKDKGHHFMLEAVNRLKARQRTVKYLIVGEGPMRGSLESEARKLGIEGDIIFTGIRNDIPQLLKLIDIFVLPSLKEGLPLALLEAAAAKKAAIATRVGAVTQVIEDGKTGLLAEPADTDSLILAIDTLLDDRKLCGYLGNNAYEKVKDCFSLRRMAQDYLKVYKGLL